MQGRVLNKSTFAQNVAIDNKAVTYETFVGQSPVFSWLVAAPPDQQHVQNPHVRVQSRCHLVQTSLVGELR